MLTKEDQLRAASTEDPPCYGKDANSDKKVYFASTHLNGSLCPCKASESDTPMATAAWGWKEHFCESFTILRFNRDLMELVWVYGSDCVPPGRRPVIGGYEGGGETLYHAVAEWDGHLIPGKAAPHLVITFCMYCSFFADKMLTVGCLHFVSGRRNPCKRSVASAVSSSSSPFGCHSDFLPSRCWKD